jgi:hypothetical protein
MPRLSTITLGVQVGGDFWPWPQIQERPWNPGGRAHLVGWLYFGIVVSVMHHEQQGAP